MTKSVVFKEDYCQNGELLFNANTAYTIHSNGVYHSHRDFIVSDLTGRGTSLFSLAAEYDVIDSVGQLPEPDDRNIQSEESFPQALNESFMDSWNNKITAFKAVTDNTLSLTITDGGELTAGKLSNADIDQLIALLQKAKN